MIRLAVSTLHRSDTDWPDGWTDGQKWYISIALCSFACRGAVNSY